MFADKAININKNAKYDGYQIDLVSMVFMIFQKNSGGTVKNENISDK